MAKTNRRSDHPASHGRSFDGMLSSNPRLGERPGTVRRDRQTSSFTPELGAINTRAEGFHPLRAGLSPIGATPKLDDMAGAKAQTDDADEEPIMLDDIKPQPRRFKRVKHPKFKKILKRTTLALACLLLLSGLYLGFKAYKTQRHVLAGGGQAPAVCDGDVPLNKLRVEGDSRVNILLLGIGGEGHQAPDLTDTIMLASLDPVNHKLALLSVPRDLYVRIPGYGSDKINAAYEDGKNSSLAKDLQGQERDGIKLADQVAAQVLGVPIHYNALVDFKAFEDAVNALGGVDANVSKELAAHEVFWIEGTSRFYTLDAPAGQQHFDGQKALYFARERHNDNDFVRGQRQRLMLSAIKDKAFSVGTLSNPIKISNLLNSFGNNVYTDFDRTSIKCLAREVSQVSSPDIASIDLVTQPNVLIHSTAFSGSTQSPIAGTYDYSQIQDYVHSQLRDSFLARENASVAVYNATNIGGLAKTVADQLKTLGYNVTKVDNAASSNSQAQSQIIDLSGGASKYTRNYLVNRFRVSAQTSVPTRYGITPPQGTKFVIILGTDANSPS